MICVFLCNVNRFSRENRLSLALLKIGKKIITQLIGFVQTGYRSKIVSKRTMLMKMPMTQVIQAHTTHLLLQQSQYRIKESSFRRFTTGWY